MKFLIVFALALSTVSAFRMQNSKLGITNGKSATDCQFRYIVGLSIVPGPSKIDWCGGSLIGNQWVLTAAHCTDGVKSITVYLGDNVRTKSEIKHTVKASDIIIHAGWNSATSASNDISLIKIPFTAYTAKIEAVKLPAISSSYSTYVGEKAVAAGWGYTSDSISSYAKDMQWASMKVIKNDDCATHYGDDITSSNICVSTAGGVSPCHSDSGGPLVLESSNVQIGLVSFGDVDGCTKGYPEAFTRLTSYLDWIKDKTGISY